MGYLHNSSERHQFLDRIRCCFEYDGKSRSRRDVFYRSFFIDRLIDIIRDLVHVFECHALDRIYWDRFSERALGIFGNECRRLADLEEQRSADGGDF